MTTKHTDTTELNTKQADKVPSSQSVVDQTNHLAQDAAAPLPFEEDEKPVEHGGQAGLEPTRYGDWEKKGRCTDF